MLLLLLKYQLRLSFDKPAVLIIFTVVASVVASVVVVVVVVVSVFDISRLFCASSLIPPTMESATAAPAARAVTPVIA